MSLTGGLFNSGLFKGGIFNGGLFQASSTVPTVDIVSLLFGASEPGFFYDPSDLSTMFQDSAGTTTVTSAGQSVGKVLDKSGRGNNASQATLSKCPLYNTDGTYHWLQHDGVDDMLSTNAVDFTTTDSATVAIGIKKLQDTLNQIVLDVGGAFSTKYSFGMAAPFASATTVSFYSRGSTSGQQAVGTIAAAPITCVFVGTSRISSDICKLRYNGSEIAANTNDQGTGKYLSTVCNIGSGPGYYRFKGNIYALIVRGVLSTEQEIIDTETYINSKTGAY